MSADTVVTCPICRRDVRFDEYRSANGLESAVVALAAANTPGWHVERGLCQSCARRFTVALAYLRSHYPKFLTEGRPILPTAVRLGAVGRLRGRGVTVAFLDSGFYAHPDLEGRILRYVDVTAPRGQQRDLKSPDPSAWHGMMTSVVACGNGSLSRGLYRGIASAAHVVLVKVGSASRIVHEDIQRGLEWIIRNRARYGIRVVNVSCGGDYQASYLEDGLSRAAERATREGVLVCAAVGNLGNAPGHPVLPPGSAPSVLTVGALDDKNSLAFAGYDMYHSSYGPTIDGLQKPEVLAPGIWVAAPILPGTPTAAQAELLTRIAELPDEELKAAVAKSPGVDKDLDDAQRLPAQLLRQLVVAKIRDNAVISGHYKHVDGTSFASPIVASVAAQMIEANPDLKPLEIKKILIDTARRIPHIAIDRQGWGVVDPDAAVREAVARARGSRPQVEERRKTVRGPRTA